MLAPQTAKRVSISSPNRLQEFARLFFLLFQIHDNCPRGRPFHVPGPQTGERGSSMK
jgi:hypothetical protein